METDMAIEKTDSFTVEIFVERLKDVHYRRLYGILTTIRSSLEDMAGTESGIDLLQSLELKMKSEMDELCRQEEILIFPLLSKLEQVGGKAESCKPFKMVKHHYSDLVGTVQQFKVELTRLSDEGKDQVPLMTLREHILTFEDALIKVQIHKEQLLFKPFRNCSNNCKAL